MHARLAETMDHVEDKRKELLQSFAGVPGDRLCQRASADGWSVAEILEHLRMVEAGVARRTNVDFSEALEGLESSREALRAAAGAASGLSLGEIKHTHPILGELDLYQWLIFVGQHEGRHKKQIERTLNSIPE